MCIIVYKPQGRKLPNVETLRACWDNNPHGAGMMWPDGNSVRIQKGYMSWDAFEEALFDLSERVDLVDTPVAFHFRIATHGSVKPGVPPSLRGEGQLRAHAPNIHPRRCRVHAQRNTIWASHR